MDGLHHGRQRQRLERPGPRRTGDPEGTGQAAAKYSFDTIAADNETATKTLQDAGVEFDFEPDVQSFKDALGGDAYYDQYKDESWYDQELLDAILAEVR